MLIPGVLGRLSVIVTGVNLLCRCVLVVDVSVVVKMILMFPMVGIAVGGVGTVRILPGTWGVGGDMIVVLMGTRMTVNLSRGGACLLIGDLVVLRCLRCLPLMVRIGRPSIFSLRDQPNDMIGIKMLKLIG
jgi:hypothetical protein